MPVPVWVNGQVLQASDVNSWFVPLAAYKTADLARSSSAQVADPDLTVTVTANATYIVEATFQYKGTATANNFGWTWTIPSGSGAGLYAAVYIGSSNTTVIESDGWTDTAHFAGTPIAGNEYVVNIRGLLAVGSTSGSFTLNWGAQAGTCTLSARSYLMCVRVG